MTIYADHAATTWMSQSAIQAMRPFYDQLYGNPSSLHQAGQAAARALTRAREQIASILNCKPREIYFTSGGSESDNQAVYSAARLGAAQGRRHIVSTTIEHHAVLRPLEHLAEHGFEVELLPVDEGGLVTAEQVARAIRPDTCLVSVMYVNNEIGSIQPVAGIGRICRERGVLFHCDAVQAPGQLPLNLQTLQTDLLSLSAHKFNGPRGIGLLFARQGIELTPLIRGGSQERGRRAGTENLPAIAGLAAALDETAAQQEENASRLTAMRDRLIRGLLDIPETVLNGSWEGRLPGNVNVSFAGIEAETLLLLLDQRGIQASSGSACTSGSLDPSHVLLALGRSPELCRGSLRLSLGPANTMGEVEYMLQSIADIVTQLRK